MKKLSVLLSFILLILFTLTGCGESCSSCSSSKTDYYRTWLNNSSISNYSEVLTYDVSYSANYSEHDSAYFEKSDELDANIKVNGTYTTTLSSLTKTALTAELENLSITPDLNSKYDKLFLKITTSLDTVVEYEYKNEVLTFNDKVSSTVYFYDDSYSFAPIYSKKSYDTTNITILNSGKVDKIVRYCYETVSKFKANGNATLTVTDKTSTITENNDYSTDMYSLKKVNNKTVTVNGDFGYYIDNEVLLFAVRNVKFSTSPTIKVFNTSYADVQEVVVSLVKGYTYNDSAVTFNGKTADVGISCQTVKVSRNVQPNSGTPIILSYQNAEKVCDGVSYNNALLTKMVTKLPAYSGALIYSLKSADITL
ncbi:MAG: hypothetical protein J6V68_03595 [Clostridia bacterium]|nr:hypothetical protein [Clostridia bacterium]